MITEELMVTKGEVEAEPLTIVRQRPWAEIAPLGFGEGLTFKEAMKPCGLDFEVDKAPSTFEYNGKSYDAEGEFALIRTDLMQKLGTCRSRYEIFQNWQLEEFAEFITKGTNLQVVTAGSLNGGRRVWVLFKLEKMLHVAGDQIEPYLLLTNAHDGNGCLVVCLTHIRVVCMNTLIMAMKGAKYKISFRHVGDIEAQIKAKVKILELKEQGNESFLKMAENMVAKKMAAAAITKLVDEVLLPMKKGLSDRGVDAVEEARSILWKCINAADLENVKDTEWGVYNGVVDFLDHARRTRRSKDDVDGRLEAERRFTRTWDDVALKEKTLKFIADYKN